MNTIFDLKEAADYLRCSKETLYRKARKGELPVYRIGSRILIRKESLDRWIAEQEATHETN